MEISLVSTSPISFEFARVGSVVRLSLKRANKNEYREKIGQAQDVILVFLGSTKIGMIPKSIPRIGFEQILKSTWRISRLDRTKSLLVISKAESPNFIQPD